MRKSSLFLLSALLFASCRTVPPVVVSTPETDKLAVETIVQGKDLESTISDIKTITDTAKETGSISKPDTVKIIEYVDKSAGQVSALNAKLLAAESSRASDNKKNAGIISGLNTAIAERDKEIKKLISYRYRFFVSCAIIAVIALLIAVYIFLRIKKLLTI